MTSPTAVKNLYWRHDIEKAYDLKIEAIVEMRSVTGVRSEGRNYIVKNLGVATSTKRIQAISRALEQIYRQGGPVCPILRTGTGRYYTRSQGELFILQPWIKGRHVNFTEVDELQLAVQAIAAMHKRPVVLATDYAKELEVPPLFEKYTVRLQRCQRALQSNKQLWKQIIEPNTWNMIHERAKTSIQSMHKRLTQNRSFLLTKSFCHRDLAPHNLMYRNPQKVTLIDFDLAGFDLSMHDLYQVINHTTYLHGWDAQDVISIMETYDRDAGITTQDRKLMYDLMFYPSLVIREIQDIHKALKNGRFKNKDCIKMRLKWVREIEQAKYEWLEQNKSIFSI